MGVSEQVLQLLVSRSLGRGNREILEQSRLLYCLLYEIFHDVIFNHDKFPLTIQQSCCHLILAFTAIVSTERGWS